MSDFQSAYDRIREATGLRTQSEAAVLRCGPPCFCESSGWCAGARLHEQHEEQE